MVSWTTSCLFFPSLEADCPFIYLFIFGTENALAHNAELGKRVVALEESLRKLVEEHQGEKKAMEQKARHMKLTWEKDEGTYREELTNLSNQLSLLRAKMDLRDFSEFDERYGSLIFQ